MSPNDAKTAVVILYTNYRGETAVRCIIPRTIRFASSEWHPEEQWLIDAYDIDKGAERSFALKDIHEWRTSEQPTPLENGHDRSKAD